MSALPDTAAPAQDAPRRRSRLGRRLAVGGGLVGAAALIALTPGFAQADPPQKLPSAYSGEDNVFQPAMDYDGDGCYPTPAIGPDGTINPGLELGGDVNGHCHDASDLDNTNSYSRSKCNNGWCAYVYDFYFEKDQVTNGSLPIGHKNDWEHIVVWVDQSTDKPEYVSTSQHGKYAVHPASEVQWDGTHPKCIYHKDGIGSHDFRLAAAGEQPENDKGTWQYPDLVSWDKFPDGLWQKLTSYDFGSATMAIKDDTLNGNLERAKPDGIPFDPNA